MWQKSHLIQKGLQKAGLTPEEAAYQTIPYQEEDLAKIKRLAELEKDPTKKENFRQAIMIRLKSWLI